MERISPRTGSNLLQVGQMKLEGPYTNLQSDPDAVCGRKVKKKATLPFTSSALQYY